MKDWKESISRLFPACSAHIVNSKMGMLPLAVAGELITGGPLVVRGYHCLPKVTTKSFVEWPTKGFRVYRTGNLGTFIALVTDTWLISAYHIVRMTAEGTLLIHSWIDSQIKLRSVRIESEGRSEVVRKSARGRASAHTPIASHPELGNEVLVSFFTDDNSSIKVNQKWMSTPKISLDMTEDLRSWSRVPSRAYQRWEALRCRTHAAQEGSTGMKECLSWCRDVSSQDPGRGSVPQWIWFKLLLSKSVLICLCTACSLWLHDPVCTESGNLADTLYSSFLPVPSNDLLLAHELSAYTHHALPCAVIVKNECIVINCGRQRVWIKVTNNRDCQSR